MISQPNCYPPEVTLSPYWSHTTSATSSLNEEISYSDLAAMLRALETSSSRYSQPSQSATVSSSDNFYELFRMEHELGRGQFGVVNLVVERNTNRKFACKLLNKNRIVSDAQKLDIEREIAIMSRLTGNSNVVELKCVFEDSDTIYLVMEQCLGGELFDLVNERGGFKEGDAAEIFAQLVHSIQFCHSRNIMHRDLKPENILLSRDVRNPDFQNEVYLTKLLGGTALNFPIKLADFGLATFIEPGEKIEGIAGSPLYLAPEVIKGKYDQRADIWSLGIILYILICGTAPFCGESDIDTIRQIERGHLDFSAPVWAQVSPEVINLIRCLLNQDPDMRPSCPQILLHPWMLKHRLSNPSIAQIGSLLSSNSAPMVRQSNPVPAVFSPVSDVQKLRLLLENYVNSMNGSSSRGASSMGQISSMDASTAALISSGQFSLW